MHFRWRTNPTVIAQYMNDSDVPRHSQVTLKPNEVCVVLENGKIVGSVSQTHMEVNPQIGLFGTLFGRVNPVRSFMFAFTGPHSIMIQVRGVSDSGDEINCLLTLKVEITRETAPRLISFPANGNMTVQASHLVELLSPMTIATALEELRKLDSTSMRTAETSDDVMFALKSRLRGTLDSHGLLFRGGFITWSKTAAEQQLQHQHDLERIKIEQNAESSKKLIELENFVANEQRKHELSAQLSYSGVQAKEKAEMQLEMDRLLAAGRFDLQKFKQEQEIKDQQAESERNKALKDAELAVEVARLEAERQKHLASPAQEAKAEKMNRAMEMFEQVQAKKRERMKMDSEQEQQRLEQHSKASESTIAALEKIAASSDDPQVQMEALRQLAELRKADVAGQKDAYKDN